MFLASIHKTIINPYIYIYDHFNLQVRIQLGLLNALHSSQGSSTMLMVNLIQHWMRPSYKTCRAHAQTRLILTPNWLPWIQSLPTNLITSISETSSTILAYFSQTKLLWGTTRLLRWSLTIAGCLYSSPRILGDRW